MEDDYPRSHKRLAAHAYDIEIGVGVAVFILVLIVVIAMQPATNIAGFATNSSGSIIYGSNGMPATPMPMWESVSISLVVGVLAGLLAWYFRN